MQERVLGRGLEPEWESDEEREPGQVQVPVHAVGQELGRVPGPGLAPMPSRVLGRVQGLAPMPSSGRRHRLLLLLRPW